jgi:hypothetical protein
MLEKLRSNLMQLKEDLYNNLSNVSNEQGNWLMNKLKTNTTISDTYLTYSLVPRFIPRTPIDLLKGAFRSSLQELNHSTTTWTTDQVARLIVLLEAGENGVEEFQEIIAMLLSTADYQEQISIYKSLLFLPHHEELVDRVVDGLRSNISEVFDSIALHNSYPYFYFEEGAWNQMVLKALFINRPIKEILGIDERSNDRLSKIAIDLAHERWAAGREVNPELWRVTVGFLDESNLEDIKRLLSGSEKEQQVAQYLCNNSDIASMRKLGNGESQDEFSWEKI